MNTRRQKYMNFRLSDSEYILLQERIKSSGMNTQQYLIRAVLDKPVPNEQLFRELLVEVKKQGVNLNQLARACNGGNVREVEESLQILLKKQSKLWDAIKVFIDTDLQGIDLTRLKEAVASLDGSKDEQDKKIVEELKKVWQYLKL